MRTTLFRNPGSIRTQMPTSLVSNWAREARLFEGGVDETRPFVTRYAFDAQYVQQIAPYRAPQQHRVLRRHRLLLARL